MVRLAAVDEVLQAIDLLRWPFVVLITLGVVGMSATTRRLIGKVTDRVTGVKAFGFEIALSGDAARAAYETIEAAFSTYGNRINGRFDLLRRKYRLDELLARVAQSQVDSKVQSAYRVTIHVPDVLFQEAFYQLLDYYPDGGGRGRRFSMRAGIIGRAFRSDKSLEQGDVTTTPDELVREWALTQKEAANLGRGRQSFSCTILRDVNGNFLALFYVDALAKNALAKLDHQAIQQSCHQCGLLDVLTTILTEMREVGPNLTLFAH